MGWGATFQRARGSRTRQGNPWNVAVHVALGRGMEILEEPDHKRKQVAGSRIWQGLFGKKGKVNGRRGCYHSGKAFEKGPGGGNRSGGKPKP